jgi:hypothetical protein
LIRLGLMASVSTSRSMSPPRGLSSTREPNNQTQLDRLTKRDNVSFVVWASAHGGLAGGG